MVTHSRCRALYTAQQVCGTHIHKRGIQHDRTTCSRLADIQVFAFNYKHKEPRQWSQCTCTHNTDQLATASPLCMPILTGSSLRVANHRRVHLHLFIISTLLGQCVQGLWSGDERTGMTVAHSICTSLHVNKLDSFQFWRNIVTSCYLAVHQPTRIQMEIKTTSTPMASSQQFTERQIWHKMIN